MAEIEADSVNRQPTKTEAVDMQLMQADVTRTCPELDIINEQLVLDGKTIVELGCGAADITRLIASAGQGRQVLALEVDEIQHAENMKITDLPNVEFGLAGAQAIPTADSSVDVVFMFKSLHHVPAELLELSFQEIARVLKPGGYAYISEPVFAGEFNEILRLFHDEQAARITAFHATRAAVASCTLELAEELFFNTPLRFRHFGDFEDLVIGVSHTQHHLTPEQHARVKERFESSMGESGAQFSQPIRVDLLRRPSS
jgi:ubiquinone/menaquinone biosynthesis C-methylase UbiE